MGGDPYLAVRVHEPSSEGFLLPGFYIYTPLMLSLDLLT